MTIRQEFEQIQFTNKDNQLYHIFNFIMINLVIFQSINHKIEWGPFKGASDFLGNNISKKICLKNFQREYLKNFQ